MLGSLPGLRPLPELGGKGGVIELAALVVFAQKVAYDDEGGLGDAVFAGLLGQCGDGAAHHLLLGPGGLIDHSGRGIEAVAAALEKGLLDFVHQPDGEEDDHGGPMRGQLCQLLGPG